MMTDVEEIIDYIKSLKRGFDKDLFQSKIEDLAHIVETSGLESDEFHTLFKVWLNLSIPITRWVSLGACLVPREGVKERTVDYAFRWLLANCENHSNFSRMGFLLDWLTAAMDTDTIDMVALDTGYEIFLTMLSFEVLTAHSIKLVYTLTKPSDVSRRRVLELLNYAKKREGKKNMLRQIQVLLGLYKSYRPECVPEDVPAIAIHTSFRKINATLLARFRKSQELRNSYSETRQHLLWINPINSMRGRNKKADPLVPNMEFTNVGSKQYNKEPQKNYLDFSDPVSLLQYSLQHPMSRPARLRALLCNETGLTLLAVASDSEQAFLSHDLYKLLSSCFLDASPHSYSEKQDLLHRLAILQRTLIQGIPVVTRFLAQYLPLWNEKDFFGEILELVEWVTVDDPEHTTYILDALTRIYYRAQPMEQCAILRSLCTMYSNLVVEATPAFISNLLLVPSGRCIHQLPCAYTSARKRHHFLGERVSPNVLPVLSHLAANISDLCSKALQINPDDIRVLYSSISAAETVARAEVRSSVSLGALPRPLTLALALTTSSAVLIDKMAALLMLYKQIFSIMKSVRKRKDQTYLDQRNTLKTYTADFMSCLYHEEVFISRKSGLVFNQLHPQLVSKLGDLIPNADAMFSLRNNLAFAPYTYMTLDAVDPSDASNKMCFETVGQNYPNLNVFLRKVLTQE